MKAIEDYKVKVSIPVTWSEMDAMGHVNNINYFRYFDYARSKYLFESGCYDLFLQLGIQFVIKSISCHFFLPIKFPDVLIIGARVDRFNDDYYIMEHFITTESLGLVAYGEVELAMIDTLSSKRVDIPRDVCLLINEFEKK